MSDLMVQAIDLSKIYRLYSKPHYRFLDMFGLLRDKKNAYTEHRALDGINLEIRRGEKVAFIGRNGAGKSTLLKLATRVIEPTSGTINVAEGASALLQIGAGFHPDFTGRENAYSYLAHLGIAGKEASQKVAALVEFAELEEYVDQPIKTYSTGMVARLMFATSTTISPKLLVLDEILGVGDAYFANKSYERIKELCERDGTTVLLVSHDVYSAAKLCDRMVWIDHGRILMDDTASTVVKAYEDSIRAQEETRLRKRKELRLSEQHSKEHRAVILELYSESNQPLPAPVYFSNASLRVGSVYHENLPLTADNGGNNESNHLVLDYGCWGSPAEWRGRMSRPMLDHGSAFHKVTGVFLLKDADPTATDEALVLSLDYFPVESMRLHARLFIDGREFNAGILPLGGTNWIHHEVPIEIGKQSKAPAAAINLRGVYGTGVVSIENIRIFDAAGREGYCVTHGSKIRIVLDYRIRQPDLNERVQILLAFQLNAVVDVCRLIARDVELNAASRTEGSIQIEIPRMWLGRGRYQISVMIARAGYYDGEPVTFYAINPDVFTCIRHAIDLEIVGGGVIASGTGVVLSEEANWAFLPRLEDLSNSTFARDKLS